MPGTDLNTCKLLSFNLHNSVKGVLFLYTDETPEAKKRRSDLFKVTWESHLYLSNPKAFDTFSTVRLSLTATKVSFLWALRRIMQKRVNVTGLILRRAWLLGWHQGRCLLKSSLCDKVVFSAFPSEGLEVWSLFLAQSGYRTCPR